MVVLGGELFFMSEVPLYLAHEKPPTPLGPQAYGRVLGEGVFL